MVNEAGFKAFVDGNGFEVKILLTHVNVATLLGRLGSVHDRLRELSELRNDQNIHNIHLIQTFLFNRISLSKSFYLLYIIYLMRHPKK